MSISYEVDQFSSQQWRALCKGLPDYNIYQTWGFGEISAADTGSQLSRIVIRENEAVIGAAQVRIKKLPLVGYGLAYVYFGPLGARSTDAGENFAAVLSSVREEYAEHRGLEVRIVPNAWNQAGDDARGRAMRALGYVADDSAPAYRTFMVDLSISADELRKNLTQKWRNGLNQAEKRGVTIETRVDDEAMRLFEELYDSMWNRKQFETGVTISSFRRLQQLLPPEEKLTIHLAYKDGLLAAGHVSSTLGDACVYLLGASNETGRDCKASYLLQWSAMTAAREAGAARYDLGGIDPANNPGVYHFKAGLGGVDTSFAGSFEARAKGIGRYLVPLAERVYRTFSPFLKRRKRNEGAATGPVPMKAQSGTSCPTMAKLSS